MRKGGGRERESREAVSWREKEEGSERRGGGRIGGGRREKGRERVEEGGRGLKEMGGKI